MDAGGWLQSQAMGFNAGDWSARLCRATARIQELEDWNDSAKARILGHFGHELERCRLLVEDFMWALELQDEDSIPELESSLPPPYRRYAITTRTGDVADFCIVLGDDLEVHPGWESLTTQAHDDVGGEATLSVFVQQSRGSDDVVEAVQDLAKELGYGAPFDIVDQTGSRFYRSRVKTKDQRQTDTADKVLYALELAALRLRQAEVSATLAAAAEALCRSLDGQERGLARVESLLVLKYPIDGHSTIIIRHLSVAEILVLERFPEVERHPHKVLGALAIALSCDPDDLSITKLL